MKYVAEGNNNNDKIDPPSLMYIENGAISAKSLILAPEENFVDP